MKLEWRKWYNCGVFWDGGLWSRWKRESKYFGKESFVNREIVNISANFGAESPRILND